MSLKLLIDEDSQAKPLLKMLRKAGHDVLTINEAGLSGTLDPQVLDHARKTNRVLLTRNCRDFEVLHQANPTHSGIIAIYQDADFSKNMSRQVIVEALNNLETASFDLTNQFIVLNHWNY